jgi:hypothetical protein
LAAIARVDLGITEREFWEMTPRQFAALSERHIERCRREGALHGVEVKVPTKPTGMGPEVFHKFAEAFDVG